MGLISTLGSAQSDHMKNETIVLGDSSVQLVKAFNAPQSKILFLNVHEDEQTSIDVAKAFAEGHLINFAYLHHQLTRRVFFNIGVTEFSVDPNRIYTRKGRRRTIEASRPRFFRGNRTAAKLATAILELIKPYRIIVTMHNNTDEAYSIRSYLQGGGEAKNTAEIHLSNRWDPDDFIYTTSADFFNHLKAEDVNVVLQDNVNFVNDGSLSVYCGINDIEYINIEAQKGHFDEQLKLTEIVYHMLETH